jgi:hypothetical protein
MSRSRKAAARSQRPARGRPSRSGGDAVQAKLLAIVACGFGLGAIILPLPLGLAAILLAGWGVWRHGRTPFGMLVLLGVSALTTAGFVIGMAL